MPEFVQRLADKLQAEGEKTLEFLQTIPAESFGRIIYADGAQWRLRDLVAHFVSAEDSMRRLVEGVASGKNQGVPEDFDLNAYNQRKASQLAGQSVPELLALFRRQRAETVTMARGFRPEDLHKQGRHPFLGIATVEDILKLMYRHLQIHQRDIRRMLKETGAAS